MITGLKLIFNGIINGLPNLPLRKFEPDELASKLKEEDEGEKSLNL